MPNLGAFIFFTFLVLFFLRPLWSMAGLLIPGGFEDTRLFLWNGWWFHHAISVLHTNPYRTTMLFHPFGARLISHDFPLWMNLVTFLGQKAGLSLIASTNLWFALTWILTGFCVYLLAFEVTGQPLAGLCAGVYAMTQSYTLARAMQNWGQFNFYCIALFLWCLLRARRLKSTSSFILAGAALAWTAACHYYFLIYSILIWLLVAAYDVLPYSISITRREGRSISSNLFLALATIAGGAAFWIWRHPGITMLGNFAISMQSPENPLFVMWVLLIAWLFSHQRIRIESSSPAVTGRGSMDSPPAPAGNDGRSSIWLHFLLAGTTGVLLSPLIWETLNLIREGGYPRQSILWKTHPMGTNLFAFFAPNPLHALWGPAVSHWFVAGGMNSQEQAASIGWVCLALVAFAQPWKEKSRARLWLWLALGASLLALGTHLHLAQLNTWCPLPFFALRFLPLVGNVRMPERWMALAAVAWSVVLAQALVQLNKTRGGSLRNLGSLVVALLLLENWPGIPYVSPPEPLPVYEQLRQLPAGGVLALPLYIGDSSIGAGDAIFDRYTFPWDHLWAQVFHEHPILGGYVGRISRRTLEAYKEDPFIKKILDLEENKIQDQEPEPAFGEYAVTHMDFKYVLAYTHATSTAALAYVKGSLPLIPLDTAGDVQLYQIQQ